LPPTPARLAEFCAVLYQNVINKFITKIDLFVEDARLETCPWAEAVRLRELWGDPKVEVLHTHKRHTYQELIDYANQNIKNLAMVSNCDIHYDGTLELLQKIDFTKYAVCLSKIEILDGHGGLFHLTPAMHGYSQDTWIFQPPIKKMSNANFFMGIQRCDNRIAYEFQNINLRPINPANDIYSYHCHLTGVRTYRRDIDCVPGPTLFVSPPYDLISEFMK
jgi:hypothetical protein